MIQNLIILLIRIWLYFKIKFSTCFPPLSMTYSIRLYIFATIPENCYRPSTQNIQNPKQNVTSVQKDITPQEFSGMVANMCWMEYVLLNGRKHVQHLVFKISHFCRANKTNTHHNKMCTFFWPLNVVFLCNVSWHDIKSPSSIKCTNSEELKYNVRIIDSRV